MNRDNITKKDVLKEINSILGIPIFFLDKILHSIIEIIVEELNEKNKMKITGFGTFKILNKKSRLGRNPKTGREHEIKARRTVVFYPSIKVKNEIND
tara:strand:- start:152 stop:442 length:291 start_codon:yes stop_codon:yes gene_type:complete